VETVVAVVVAIVAAAAAETGVAAVEIDSTNSNMQMLPPPEAFFLSELIQNHGQTTIGITILMLTFVDIHHSIFCHVSNQRRQLR
jgi:hypothetical protein